MAELLDKNRHFTCPNYKNIVVLIFKGEEIMWYWIIVALLVSGCAAMLFVSFSGIKQSKAELARAEGRGRKKRRDEYEDEYEAEVQNENERRKRMQRISARNVRNAAGRSFWKILTVGKNIALHFATA